MLRFSGALESQRWGTQHDCPRDRRERSSASEENWRNGPLLQKSRLMVAGFWKFAAGVLSHPPLLALIL
jgi:hypothetical protein